jgi:hypothetical protein
VASGRLSVCFYNWYHSVDVSYSGICLREKDNRCRSGPCVSLIKKCEHVVAVQSVNPVVRQMSSTGLLAAERSTDPATRAFVGRGQHGRTTSTSVGGYANHQRILLMNATTCVFTLPDLQRRTYPSMDWLNWVGGCRL